MLSLMPAFCGLHLCPQKTARTSDTRLRCSGAVVDILQPLPERIKVGTVVDYDPFSLALTSLTKAGREVSVL